MFFIPFCFVNVQASRSRACGRKVRSARPATADAPRHRAVQRAAGGRQGALDRRAVRRAARKERWLVSTHMLIRQWEKTSRKHNFLPKSVFFPMSNNDCLLFQCKRQAILHLPTQIRWLRQASVCHRRRFSSGGVWPGRWDLIALTVLLRFERSCWFYRQTQGMIYTYFD